MNAVLIIDKPTGLTSHDVVNRVRRILRERSIGHLGTLDPMATGVLPLVIGNLTRLAQFYTSSEKTYEGTIRFGFATDTYDADGEPTTPATDVTLSREVVEAAATRFRGVIEQTPPAFSAKKIAGVPAYKLARKQKEVILKPVQVEIKEFEILSVQNDRATFRARVASGTYMRSVAHEMGHVLACGAHLESLRRTAVAEFTIQDAHTLEDVANAVSEQNQNSAPNNSASNKSGNQVLDDCHPDQSFADPKGQGSTAQEPRAMLDSTSNFAVDSLFVHLRKILPALPSVTADAPTVALIRSGRTINLPDVSRARQIKVFSDQRTLVAIAARIAGTLFHPKIVLATQTAKDLVEMK